MVIIVLLSIMAYLIGSIPFGLYISRLWGIKDIRELGSGNIGTTNVYRCLGVVPALLTLTCDLLKGSIPVFIATLLEISSWTPYLVGLSTIFGHIFSLFLRFRGGKGVATFFGVFVVLAPISTIVAFLMWLSMVLLFRMISLASITAVLTLTIILLVIGPYPQAPLTMIFAGLFIILKHRENIRRMLMGTEPTLSKRKNP